MAIGAPVSWQLLFGVVPDDRHRIELVALPDGRGFRESSSSWWHRVWWHERTLLDDPGGCVVRDSVEIEHRLGVLDRIEGWAVRQSSASDIGRCSADLADSPSVEDESRTAPYPAVWAQRNSVDNSQPSICGFGRPRTLYRSSHVGRRMVGQSEPD